MVSDAFRRADAIVSRLFAAGPSKKEIPIDGDRSCLAAGPFCAKTIPGKGVGLCATRDIGIGDAVLVEDPLCIVEIAPQRQMSDPVIRPLLLRALAINHNPNVASSNTGDGSLEASKLMNQVAEINARRAFAQLSEEARQALLSLHDAFHTPSTPGGVLRCNSYGIRGGEAAALYRTFSRVNHSCNPNLRKEWNTNGRLRVIAIARIRAGQELLSACAPFSIAFCRPLLPAVEIKLPVTRVTPTWALTNSIHPSLTIYASPHRRLWAAHAIGKEASPLKAEICFLVQLRSLPA